jgi:hypothetical protein
LDALDPIPETVKLDSGLTVALEPLRARQFFKLLRIVTHGALPQLRGSLLDLADQSTEEMTGRLLAMTLLAVPDAEDETIDFLRSMCKPLGLIERRNLNKQDQDRNLVLWAQLDQELDNPDLNDVVTIIEAVIRREAADIQALGKRLAGLLKLADKTGQLSPSSQPPSSPNPTASTPASSADSPAPSTSSATNTAGTTNTSETSPSADSASVSQPSGNDASTSGTDTSNG